AHGPPLRRLIVSRTSVQVQRASYEFRCLSVVGSPRALVALVSRIRGNDGVGGRTRFTRALRLGVVKEHVGHAGRVEYEAGAAPSAALRREVVGREAELAGLGG